MQESTGAPDFVLLTDLVPSVLLDIRYYSAFNFTGQRIPGYLQPVAILTRQAAEAMKQVCDLVRSDGLTLKIWDAYRPQCAVDFFMAWAETEDAAMKSLFYPDLEKKDLFPRGYLARRSAHTRGSTVDLTLVDMKTQQELDMGGPFDFFGELSHTEYPGLTPLQRENRMRLRQVMTRCGFRAISSEWWHFTLEREPFPDTCFQFPVHMNAVHTISP